MNRLRKLRSLFFYADHLGRLSAWLCYYRFPIEKRRELVALTEFRSRAVFHILIGNFNWGPCRWYWRAPETKRSAERLKYFDDCINSKRAA